MIIIFITVGIVIILIQFRSEIEEGYQYAGRAAAPLKAAVIPLPAAWKETLTLYFPYYNLLPEGQKKMFEQRMLYFMYSKRWIPRNFPAVTDEMKVMISASAVQLTFGLPTIYLRHFSTILIYPDSYYSNITKQYHKGEVNPAFGIIVLSWKSFMEGYFYPDNAVNLGLHELAHALRLENIIFNEEFQFFDEGLLNRMDAIARQVCASPTNLDIPLLRPYACTNVHEFFSVAVENFFEKPVELKQTMPELYAILSRLLNQDPAGFKTQ